MMAARRPLARVLSGGVAHAFSDTSAEVAAILEEVGIASTTTTDIEAGLDKDQIDNPVDLLVFNVFRDADFASKYSFDVPDPAYTPSWTARQMVLSHLERGGGLLAVHGAVISFADWHDWPAILGARWISGVSGHPKRSHMWVDVVAGSHPIVDGLSSYQLDDDEAYGFLELRSGLTVLSTSTHGGVDHPMLWVREFGGGRVAYLAPCHGVDSLRNPAHRELFRRTVRWLVDTEDPHLADGS